MLIVGFIGLLLMSILRHASGAVEPVDDASMRLRHDLFATTRYDPANSPYLSTDTLLSISIKLMVLHIAELNEYDGVLSVNGWFLAAWTDHRLRWTPADYGHTFYVRASQLEVWLPDLTLYNDAEALQMNKYGEAQVLIYYDGTVYWGAPMTLKSTCAMDHKYYPFDEYFCSINMGSWSNANVLALNVHYLDKNHEEEILQKFTSPNPQWEIFTRKDEISNITYACCPHSVFPYFKLSMGIRRLAPSYKYLLVTPSVITMILTLAIFWIPVEGHMHAKLIVGGISIVTLVLLLSFLAWEIPRGGQSIPAIVLFCGNSLVLSTLSVLTAIIIVKINRQSLTGKPVPPYLQTVTNIFVNCACISGENSNVWAKFVSSVRGGVRMKDDPQLLENTQVEIGGENGFAASSGETKSVNRGWIEVSIAFDRICFILYSFIFLCIIFASFA